MVACFLKTNYWCVCERTDEYRLKVTNVFSNYRDAVSFIKRESQKCKKCESPRDLVLIQAREFKGLV